MFSVMKSIISRWYGKFKRERVFLSDDSRARARKPAIEIGDVVRNTMKKEKILQEALCVRKLFLIGYRIC